MNRDFAEMLSALSAAGADFLLVGAYAVAAHGAPRATGDLDLWVRPSPENAPRVVQALKQFGAPLFDLTVGDLSTEGIVFQIGVEPNRIDILTSISGVEFEPAWDRRVEIQVEGIAIHCIGLDDLITNKSALGREQDIADVAALRRRQGQASR